MVRKSTYFLIGPMGAGKTTIGRKLAEELGLEFLDTDEEIERRTGTTISIIFDIEGEEGFRAREQKVLDDFSQSGGAVIATGGGSILTGENQRIMSERGTVIYLATTVAEQMRRTRNKRNRPLLETDDPEATLKDLAAERDPLYERLADIQVESDGRRASSVVKEIIDKLSHFANPHS